MFVKLTKSGPRRYVQLAESYRDADGKVRQRTIASLGRLEAVGEQLDSIVRGLHRVTGRELPDPVETPAPQIDFSPSLALGDCWVLDSLWHQLGFDRLAAVLNSHRKRYSPEALLRVMVFNRLCDPQSKLGILRWLERSWVPGVDRAAVTHQRLLRTMDALVDSQSAIDGIVSSLLRPLIDVELSVVFYDLTTVSTEGLSVQSGEVRHYGRSKEGVIRRQFVLGVVQTAEGLPIHHEVFDGNVAEVSTLKASLDKVMAKFPIRRVIAIADRGLMSSDNLEQLQAIKTPSGEPLEYILAVPGRRYGEFAKLLAPLQKKHFAKADEECIAETSWNGLRLVVAHDPGKAAELTARRDATIKMLEDQAADWSSKLDEQDAGMKKRGRPLSDGGARAKFYHQVLEERLGSIIKVDLKSPLFSYQIDRDARRLAELNDGKLLLVSNVDAKDLDAEQIVARYKALADIERGFRVLKSEIEIGPFYHRLPHRIRAHAQICFIALILHRVMRMRLRESGAASSPERALEQLRQIQFHSVTLNGARHTGVSTLSAENRDILRGLGASKPPTAEQLSLL